MKTLVHTIIFLLTFSLVNSSLSDQDQKNLQHRMLNALESSVFVGAWKADRCRAYPATDVEPKAGACAVLIEGKAQDSGAKIDATIFDGNLEGCRSIAVWVHAKEDSNVETAGFQIKDSNGEWLMCTIPVDWIGWKEIELDPVSAPFKQAYHQKDHDGKVDLPVTSVHMIWFAKNAGRTYLAIDALTAKSEISAGEHGVRLTAIGSNVSDAGKPLAQRFVAENFENTVQETSVSYSLQTNPDLDDSLPPDPILGFDHALGCKNTWSIDGVEKGDAKMCDGDDTTGSSTEWGKDFKEAVVTVELDKARDLIAASFQAGDANWVQKVDISVSTDGKEFKPVENLQNYDLNRKWAYQPLPWPKQPVKAKTLKLRFHDNGKGSNCIRLPVSLMLYDGSANDEIVVPKTGQFVTSGNVSAKVPANGFTEILLKGADPLLPGSYLFSYETSINGIKNIKWGQHLVKPADEVVLNKTRRFGINAALIDLAPIMKECGFGWVRFENTKWAMYCPQKDKYAFDGTVGPWHVNHSDIFSGYKELDMKVLPYVFQTPGWATSAPDSVTKNRSSYPPKNVEDYGEAIFQLVAWAGKAKVDASKLMTPDKKSGMDLISAVELWNEPNLNDPGWGPFVGPISEYFMVMRAGAEGSRRADPSLPVSSCGWAGLGLETVGQMSDFKYDDGKTPLDFVDIINVHFYSGRQEPEICGWDPNVDRGNAPKSGNTYPEKVEDLVAWRDKLKSKAEIWLTETGNDVGGPIGRSERYQAAKVPRTVMIALALGIEKVFIYREMGSTPAQHAGAGLMRNDGTLRPSWFTTATMIRQLQGFNNRALRLPSPDPKVWIFLWEEGSKKLVTAWRYEGNSKLGLDLGKANVTDAFGLTSNVDSTANLDLGIFPIYITPAAMSANLEKLIQDGKKEAEERLAERKALAAVPAQLFDFGPPDQKLGILKGYGLPRTYTPVNKTDVWDPAKGYGFTSEAMGDDYRGWIQDPLERDSCKMGPGNIFKFKLQPGKSRVTISAAAVNNQEAQITIKTATGIETRPIGEKLPPPEIILEGEQIIEITVPNYGSIRWISAIGNL